MDKVFVIPQLPLDPATGRRGRLCFVSRTNGTWFVLAAALAGGGEAIAAAHQEVAGMNGGMDEDGDLEMEGRAGGWQRMQQRLQQQRQQRESKRKEKERPVKLYLTAAKDYQGRVEYLEKVKALYHFK